MRYEAELIYVASHDTLAGSDTHLGGGAAGVCLCVSMCVEVRVWMVASCGNNGWSGLEF